MMQKAHSGVMVRSDKGGLMNGLKDDVGQEI